MSGPEQNAPPTPLSRRRPGPGSLVMLALGALLVLWLAIELLLNLIGIAASPVGWLLSILGTITGFVFGRGG